MVKMKILLPVAILVILSAAVITYKVFFFEDFNDLVPRLTNLNLEQAIEVLESRGLQYRVTKIDSTEPNPTDPVVDQNPIGGTKTCEGMAVEIIVSNRPMPIPEIDSLTIAEAVRLTGEYGFEVEDTLYAYHDIIPEGLVIGYRERSVSTTINKPVSIVVSKGPAMLPVPDVLGKHVNQAEKLLRKAGFSTFEYRIVSSKTQPENYVVDIEPKNRKVKRTETLYISVSDGIRY